MDYKRIYIQSAICFLIIFVLIFASICGYGVLIGAQGSLIDNFTLPVIIAFLVISILILLSMFIKKKNIILEAFIYTSGAAVTCEGTMLSILINYKNGFFISIAVGIIITVLLLIKDKFPKKNKKQAE